MAHFLDDNLPSIWCERGNLPHRHQDGVMQFITFRLADSLPQDKLRELEKIRDEYLRNHPLPHTTKEKNHLQQLMRCNAERYLDAGYGECPLGDRENRRLLVATFAEKNEVEYLIDAYVIMPNHVHMLITVESEDVIWDVIGRIKGKASYLINKRLKRSGRLWQEEMWDRAVRDDIHLKHCVDYIINNPRHLPADNFALYVRPGLEFVD